MPRQKTSTPANIDSVLFPDAEMRKSLFGKTTSGGKFKTMSKTHVNAALTGYLRSMSLINDDEEVTNFNKAPDALDIKIERVQ